MRPSDLHWQRIANGRTDLAAEWLAAHPAADADARAELINVCAYFGDVGSVRVLLSMGVERRSLGDNLGLNAAAFHGHWQLCECLIEQGADARFADPQTGETALHAAVGIDDAPRQVAATRVLLDAGADPNAVTLIGAATGSFMRDVRTRGETPLHRAAAFGSVKTIEMLLAAGANVAAKDAAGDSALSWASWNRRSAEILRLLLHGDHAIHRQYQPMRENLVGGPVAQDKK